MKDKIRGFLARHIKGRNVQDDDDIFALGLVSSLFTLQLVLFVEQEFEFEVSSDDMDIANFRSVDAIAALVERNIVPVTLPQERERSHELRVE